jgi:deoxycytidylate deaminase
MQFQVGKSSESGLSATTVCYPFSMFGLSKLIYQSGIEHVLYRNSYRSNDGINFLTKAGVPSRTDVTINILGVFSTGGYMHFKIVNCH